MAKKTGKAAKSGRGNPKPRSRQSRMRRINTHTVFDASKDLKNAARDILKKLEGTPQEAKNLKDFISAIEDLQLSIKSACEMIEGGNPMFHDFKVRP